MVANRTSGRILSGPRREHGCLRPTLSSWAAVQLMKFIWYLRSKYIYKEKEKKEKEKWNGQHKGANFSGISLLLLRSCLQEDSLFFFFYSPDSQPSRMRCGKPPT